MKDVNDYPIDRVLFETTEFCENNCFFCYGDYGPQGEHMSSEDFTLFLDNLLSAELLEPGSLLILFGGEILNHPECLEICRIALEKKLSTMKLVLITSGKFREEYADQVNQLMAEDTFFHHWEVSIKDFESFEFGLKLLENGNRALFRYDYLDSRSLKKSIDRFIRHVKISGMWKDFSRSNRGLEKRLRRTFEQAGPDMVIVEEFNYPYSRNGYGSSGLIFSPLDRSVMRKGGIQSQAECSLFNFQYGKAVHVTKDGTLYPCHLPRFKKGCEPLGNVHDRLFLENYRENLTAFKEALKTWQREAFSRSGVCMGGCRGNLKIGTVEE